MADAIVFRHLESAGAVEVRPHDRVELVYRTAVDEYSGYAKLQLVVEYLAPLPR
jgi:hypothetical protein